MDKELPTHKDKEKKGSWRPSFIQVVFICWGVALCYYVVNVLHPKMNEEYDSSAQDKLDDLWTTSRKGTRVELAQKQAQARAARAHGKVRGKVET